MSLVNGGIQFDVESVEDIKAHREKFSKSYVASDPNNIWNKNFDAMALKTCVIQALKLCPISIEALEAVRKDELADAEGEMINVTPLDYNLSDSLPQAFEQKTQARIPQNTPMENLANQAMEITPEEEDEIDEAWENAETPDALF